MSKEDWLSLEKYLMTAIKYAEASGVDFIVLASNTPHVVFEELQKKASVPMLSIIEPTCKAVKELGLKKIAWLGTAFTMEQDYLKKMFIENGIEVVTPSKEERAYVDRVIAEELEFGIVIGESQERIDGIIQRLIDNEGVQGVVLGCTELPLMYANVEMSIPCFDTMKYHIKGIVEHMLME